MLARLDGGGEAPRGSVYEDRAYAGERARESYRYYDVLDGRSLEAGGVFGEKNGWERVNYCDPGRPGRRAGADERRWGWGRPAFFDRVGEEHRAVRERAGLFDMTSFGRSRSSRGRSPSSSGSATTTSPGR